ncbi:hypothetical protein IWW34DRAFT_796318 [Fusarium oxysporum f. sp. albedinis]|nr:hypothetical protein IWW34DRAFT_796318 [Fusarium oxysporum f. sp. albedinis]
MCCIDKPAFAQSRPPPTPSTKKPIILAIESLDGRMLVTHALPLPRAGDLDAVEQPKAPAEKLKAEELKACLTALFPEDHSQSFRQTLVTSKPVFGSREPKNSKFGCHVPNVPMQDLLASEQGQSQEPKLSLVGMQCLKLLRTSCTNLKTLELVVHPGNSLGVARNAPIDLRLKDLLSRINEELRRIPLLERVIIRCFGNLDPEVEKMMKDFDWEVDTDQSKPY